MSDFTYETTPRQNPLETYEWDNTWIEHSERTDQPRVLYIGDSISCGTRKAANQLFGERFLFDGFGTSKALDNPVFFESVCLFASQEPRRDLILLNNGLHGWHMEDEGEYARCYEAFVKRLMQEYPQTPLFLLLTTYVRDDVQCARVRARNKIVEDIGQRYALPVIDLYTVAYEHRDLITDGVHFSTDGYQYLARKIFEAITAI